MIQYRVFDIIQNKYIDNRNVSIAGDGTLTVVGVEGKYHSSIQPPNDLAPRFIIEQYTGLKDKNGVEIAVGDILRVVSRLADNPKLFFVEMRHEEWNGDVFDLVCYDSNNDNSPIHHVESFDGIVENGEVMGNIHENAELLEEYKSGE